nr:hypothetical protein CFP56_73750 [Quercus suber]
MSSLYDFDVWMQQTRQVFKELDVWQYADPDLGAESTESSTDDETINLPSTRSTATLQPTRPNKPEKGNVTDTTYREAISLYTDLCKIFKMKQAKLKKATAYLRSTLVRDIWREVSKIQDLRSQLTEIRTRYQPSLSKRSQIFNARLDRLRSGYKMHTLNQWLLDWQSISLDMEACNYVSHTDLPAQFESAVATTDSVAAGLLRSAFRSPRGIDLNIPPTLDELIDEFRNIVDVPVSNSRSGRVNATFNNEPSEQSASDSKQKDNRKKGKVRDASQALRPQGRGNLTGKTDSEQCATLHECNVVNHRIRPRVSQRDDQYNKRLEHYRNYLKNNIGLAKRFLRKFNDPLIKDLVDQHDKSNTEMSSALRNAQGPRINSVSKHFDNTSDLWLYNPGSDIHVINDSSKAGFVLTDTTVRVIKAGNVTIQTAGCGTAQLSLYDHRCRRKVTVTLNDVAYIPGFHVNIVSELRLRQKGYWFTTKDHSICTTDGTQTVRGLPA